MVRNRGRCLAEPIYARINIAYRRWLLCPWINLVNATNFVRNVGTKGEMGGNAGLILITYIPHALTNELIVKGFYFCCRNTKTNIIKVLRILMRNVGLWSQPAK